ncbi:RagB/SusD family nutrient uptake outer membrane protein [Chitinophagaceae bacterium LB-8]|uniref:RagB/SusD family nutrient uptake outer membrane protein n=1 Tax=Paraflavisolibacter caeni TaxID=2982496 RepID=A0A9X2XZ31_9BACT|nr:RagB/SusD family nutrient uptake outer membrane protein [Paraflavisolibacter caeni]MCU7551850.1 RagB/SusD family nutrient uptake outer membrane protein [Paraflavisolibacter caeni]
MKKTLYKVIYFIMPLLILVSCKKEKLNVENPNVITEDQFWKTESDAQQGLNAAYAMFYKPGLWSRWIYFRLDLTSDEGFSKSPWVELADWTRFQYINYNFWEGNVQSWRDTYKAVFRTNQVLANVAAIEFADQTKKDKILAQAKFLRALHYYYAAIMWENVPLVLEPSKPDDLPVQSTLAQVWAQVEKDLTEAAQVLPVEWDAPNVGRPTKGSVMAYLARAYMQQRKWQEAKTALDYFFTGAGAGKYDLVANYKDNFTHTNENNKESVYEIQFSDVNKGGDGDDPNATMSTNRPQFFAPRSIGWSDGQARYWLVNEFKKEKTTEGKIDPRLQHSLFYPALEADFNDKIYGRSWQWDSDEAWFRKYARDYYRNNEDYFAQNNFRLVRFADILLMYAEVLNELGQTANAYQYVDKVRSRVKMASLAVAYPTIGMDKDKFRDRLKMERVLELSGESVRWADLKRWGDLETAEKVAKVAERDPDFNNFQVGKHIRLPLPQIEVQNNSNLTQNPQY